MVGQDAIATPFGHLFEHTREPLVILDTEALLRVRLERSRVKRRIRAVEEDEIAFIGVFARGLEVPTENSRALEGVGHGLDVVLGVGARLGTVARHVEGTLRVDAVEAVEAVLVQVDEQRGAGRIEVTGLELRVETFPYIIVVGLRVVADTGVEFVERPHEGGTVVPDGTIAGDEGFIDVVDDGILGLELEVKSAPPRRRVRSSAQRTQASVPVWREEADVYRLPTSQRDGVFVRA